MGTQLDLWGNRTELEKGLILILIFLVPFLLLLCGLHVYLFLLREKIDEQILTGLEDKNEDTTLKTTTTISTEKPTTINIDEPEEISFKKRMKRSISNCECPILRNGCYNIFEPQQFISSISETVFEDDTKDFKFKCSAVVLTESYILTFYNCLSNNLTLKIRSSSEYWSKDGYIRQLSHFININNTFIVAKLTTPLPNHGITIRMVEISNDYDLKSIKQFDIYRWNSKFTSDLNQRLKYNKLNRIRLNATKCMNKDKHFDGFCALEIREPGINDDITGRDPIFEIDSNKLVGMEATRFIWEDKVEHYYIFIRNSYIEKYINNIIEMLPIYL